MARNLSYTVHSIFENCSGNTTYSYIGTRHSQKDTGGEKYLEIPTVGMDEFEMPTMAFKAFLELAQAGKLPQAIVIKLNHKNNEPYFKTLERNLIDILTVEISKSRLIKIEVKRGNEDVRYYGTKGAILDEYLQPVMMCMWKIAKKYQDEKRESFKYVLKQPVTRISPSVFLRKDDPMMRFLTNKFLTTLLSTEYEEPPSYLMQDCFQRQGGFFKPKVEIMDNTFHIKTVDRPSIQTTDRQLADTVLDHLDDLFINP